MQVSIIIVNYNTNELLKGCLVSIYKYTKDIQIEIIVSDNGSTDGSVEMIKDEFPGVVLIENEKNIGFGAANNRGLNIAKGEFIFFLNSDTILLNNALKYFYDYWYNYKGLDILGALGANLLDINHKITYSYGFFFSFSKDVLFLSKEYLRLLLLTIGVERLHSKTPNMEKFIGKVDVIIGAALFMKNDKFAYFDECFFLYHEETDLQYRLFKNNKSRILIDGPQIIHYQGKSSIFKNAMKYNSFCSPSKINDYISKVKFYKKNHHHYIYVLILKILILFIWLFPPVIIHTRKYIKELLLV
jgi:GT2 family glycosyltransferase